MAGGSAGDGPIAGLQKNEPKIGCKERQNLLLRNEAQLYRAALRSSLMVGEPEAASRVEMNAKRRRP